MLIKSKLLLCRVLTIGAALSNIRGVLTNLLPRLEYDLVCVFDHNI